MKRPMIPDPRRPEQFETPEQLFREIARMDRAYRRGGRYTGRTRRRLAGGILAVLAGAAAASAAVASTCTFCYTVTADGRQLACIRGQDTYVRAVEQVEEEVSSILQEAYTYPADARVSPAIAPREKLQTERALKDSLMETVEQIKEEYVLTVDGEPVAACEEREEIVRAIEQAKAAYTSQDTVDAYVSSQVDVSRDYLPVRAEVLDADALTARLTSPPEREAQSSDLSAEPSGEAEDPGGEPTLPLLEVRTVEEVSYCREIPAPVEEREDGNLLLGERLTIQEGIPGTETVTERISLRCGVEEARETVSVVTETEPVAAVVAVGTAQGAEGARGRFRWPCRGRVSSPFGTRRIFGSESRHTGTDIAAPAGTEIRAAADGTVIWAGGKGTYGNLVQVDHGNGFVTYYAHCSEILVREGDWVEQGQTVALVGSTGRSTGPHCHFEVRWQGEPLDPAACLP